MTPTSDNTGQQDHINNSAASLGTQLVAITEAERKTLISAAGYIADSRPDSRGVQLLADAVLRVANRGGVLPDDDA